MSYFIIEHDFRGVLQAGYRLPSAGQRAFFEFSWREDGQPAEFPTGTHALITIAKMRPETAARCQIYRVFPHCRTPWLRTPKFTGRR